MNTSTDAGGGFTLPKLAEGRHQLQLDVGDLGSLRGTGTGGPAGAGPQGLRGGFIIPLIALAVADAGNHSVGFAREIPQGTKTLQVTVLVGPNGHTKAVDLGDGAGLVDVSGGKELPGTNRGSALVGRVVLLQNEPVAPAIGGPVGPGGGKPPPYADSRVKALPGVLVNLGGRQVQTDTNGLVSLDKPPGGVFELTISQKTLGVGTGQPVLLGLLLPSVQPARESKSVTHTFTVTPGGPDPHLRLGVNQKGEVTSVSLNGGQAVAVGDFNGDGRLDVLAKNNPSGGPRLAIVLPVNDPPTLTASVPSPRTNPTPQPAPPATNLDKNFSVGLPNVGTTFQGRSVSSNADGVVPLPSLRAGKYELAFEFPLSPGSGQPTQQRVLIGLLLPAVQKVRGFEVTLTPGLKGQLKFEVLPDGKVTNANGYVNGGITACDDWEAPLKLLSLPGGSNDTKLVFLSNDPAPQTRTASGPGGGPTVWSQSTPLSGVKTTWLDSSGRSVGHSVSDGSGFASVGSLPQGRYTVSFEAPPTGGNQPQQVLIGLLLPAVQKVRYVTMPGAKGQVAVDVGANNEFHTISWTYTNGGVTHEDTWDQNRLVIPSGGGNARLLFAVAPTPDSNALLRNKAFFEKEGIRLIDGVSVTATSPGGVFQGHSDKQGVTRFGNIGIGTTIFVFNGGDLASSVTTAVGPNNPTPQKTLIELMVVIAIIATDVYGQPVIFTASYPANDLPKTPRAEVRIGKDGRAMEANFGRGPQAPLSLTKTGSGTLALSGANTYSGSTFVNAGTLKVLEDTARGGKPAEIAIVAFAYDPKRDGTQSGENRMLPLAGVTLARVTGPAGAFQLATDERGAAWLPKLPVGKTSLDFSEKELATALTTLAKPNDPKPQKTLVELLVVVWIMSWFKAEDPPTTFVASFPANALPKALQAKLTVDQGGKLSSVDWSPQSLRTADFNETMAALRTADFNETMAAFLRSSQNGGHQPKAGETAVFVGGVFVAAGKR